VRETPSPAARSAHAQRPPSTSCRACFSAALEAAKSGARGAECPRASELPPPLTSTSRAGGARRSTFAAPQHSCAHTSPRKDLFERSDSRTLRRVPPRASEQPPPLARTRQAGGRRRSTFAAPQRSCAHTSRTSHRPVDRSVRRTQRTQSTAPPRARLRAAIFTQAGGRGASAASPHLSASRGLSWIEVPITSVAAHTRGSAGGQAEKSACTPPRASSLEACCPPPPSRPQRTHGA